MTEVLVVGAGIVGAACAYELARQGLEVEVVAPGPVGGGATAEGMGHLILLDDSPAQVALLKLSMRLWKELAPELSSSCEVQWPGTLWVAEDEDDMNAARERARGYERHGVRTELLDDVALRDAEPRLRPGLAGGLRVPGDGIVFPPAVASELLRRAVEEHGARLRLGCSVQRLDDEKAILDDGTCVSSDWMVNAAGIHALTLLPERLPGVRMRPRKGHLVITERYPGFCRHQLVELGYLKSAHGNEASSVAFNLQPRPNGQLLLGSSRQFCEDRAVDASVVGRMVQRALSYAPAFADCRAVRAWTGFRAATDDHLPLIGAVPGRPRLLLAAGLEGLGVTAAPATARLIADIVLGRSSEIDRKPFNPGRAS